MAEGFKTAEPREYHWSFLKENCRADGRDLREFRTTTLNVGSITTADGSALVKLGNTTVVCGVKAELAAPAADAPDRGYVVPNVDLPPLCSSRFRAGPPGELAQAASLFVADVLVSSEAIGTEDLCIERGKLCWVLYCDLMCLDYDGNLLDAAVVALLAALRDVRLPRVTLDPETGTPAVDPDPGKRTPLQVRRHPACASFAVFDGDNDAMLVVADPTAEEESLASAALSVVTDEEERLCCVHKPGGAALSAEKLQECVGRAAARHREIRKLVDKVARSVPAKTGE